MGRLDLRIVSPMRSAALRLSAGLAAVAAVAMACGAPLAAPASPFAYRMEVTPEDGQVDPAIDRRYTTAFSQCQKQAQVTSDSAVCFEAEFQRQDGKLNAAWRATLARLSPEARRPLLEAQRKWIGERDPFCRKDADGFSGGTIAPVVYCGCRVELTIRRTIWLEQLH